MEIDLEQIYHGEVYRQIKMEAKQAKLPIELYIFLEYEKIRAPHVITPLERLVPKNAPYYKGWMHFVKSLQKENTHPHLEENLKGSEKETEFIEAPFWGGWDIGGRALTALTTHFSDKTIEDLQTMTVSQLSRLSGVGKKTAKEMLSAAIPADDEEE
jgi:hypothetical protein